MAGSIRLLDSLMEASLCRLETDWIMPDRLLEASDDAFYDKSKDRAQARDALRPIWWTAGLSLGAVFVATMLHGVQLRASALDDHRHELAISARAMALSLSRTLVLTQELLEQTDTLVRETPDATDPLLASRLREELRDERLISEIAIVDAQGRVLASSDPRHLGRPTSLTETTLSRAEKAGQSARLLESVSGISDETNNTPAPGKHESLSRVSGHVVVAVPLQAQMSQPGLGRLSAVAVLPKSSLLEEMASLATPRTGVFLLQGLEGRTLLHSGQPTPETPVPPGDAARWLARAVRGATADMSNDGRVWLAHREEVPGFPLMIQAGTPLAEVRQGWLSNLMAPIGLLLLSLVVVSLMTRSALIAARQRIGLQQQLTSSNQQLSNLFENAGEGIITFGRGGIVRQLNRAAQDMLGVRAELAIGRTLDDLFPPDEVSLRRHLYPTDQDDFDGAPELVRSTFATRRRDGRPLTVEFSASKYLEGRESRVIAIIRDVTHSKAAEKRFQALFERSGEPHMLFVGPSPLRIVDCNEAAVRTYRAQSRTDLIGITTQSFVLDDPEDPLAATPDRLAEFRKEITAAGIAQRDLRVRRLDGSYFRAHITGSLVPLGDQDGLLICLHDLSNQEAEEQSLRAARDAAQSMANARSRFLAVMSHELRTPLTGIMGMIELLDESRLDVEQARHLGALRSSSRSLMAVVNDILDHARFETGQINLAKEPFDLPTLIHEVAQTHRVSAQARGNQLKVSVEPLAATRLIGDPQRLRQVMHNLIGNAVKFTQAGEIRIETTGQLLEHGLALSIRVADTGIGIEPQAAARLFQPFAQAGPMIERDYGGSGLGLAICKQLVEAMGGSITLDSVPGRGACFTIALCLPVGVTSESEAQPLASVGHASRPLRILVADDNEINRLLLQSRLERDGHHVRLAEDGLQVMAMARKETPDLILMDMQMPVCDGASATREIRAWGGAISRVPIWGLSADVLPELQAEHMTSGLTGYLTKPIDWLQVQAVLAKVASGVSGYDAAREPPSP